MVSPIVQTAEGKVQGTSGTDVGGTKYHAFLSIPYAKPPVGDLRFKATQPLEPWEGVKYCTEQGNGCVRADLTPPGSILGSEDCLNLHVFTRTLPVEEQKLKPVMVWIHGGGFIYGSNEINTQGPEYFMTEDVVIVMINYRLGLLGFLSLEDPLLEVPGNAGLKDQVQALKWVQKNIKNFNGDPNNVTIFGISAGGASVEYLTLSPSAKNLFHRAIIQSGSTLCPWSRGVFDPADFVKYLGHPHLNEADTLKLLMDMPAIDLCKAQMDYQQEHYDGEAGLIGPCIEKPNPTAFLTDHPIDIIRGGDIVPLIIGYCNREGLAMVWQKIMDPLLNKKSKGMKTLNSLLPFDTNFKDADLVMEITAKIREFYGREEYKDDEYLLLTDAMFLNGIIASARNMGKYSKSPVYLYRFSFDGKLNWMKNLVPDQDLPGACHGDDHRYQWKMETLPLITEEPEKSVHHRMIKMWTNFAREGNPTPNGSDLNIGWEPIQGETINFMDIGKELVPGVNPEEDRMAFWREIFNMNPITAKF